MPPFPAAICAALGVLTLVATVPVGSPAAAAAGPIEASGGATRTVRLAGVDATALDRLRVDAAASEVVPTSADGALLGDSAAASTPVVLTPEQAVPRTTLVAVTWSAASAAAHVVVDVRLREAGEWSRWQRLEQAEVVDEAAGAVLGTDPLLSAGADGVQVRVDTADGSTPSDLRLVLVDGGSGTAPGAARALTAVGADEGSPTATSAVAAVSAGPAVVTRAQWGADERLRRPVPLNATVKAIGVHHTAGTNNYTASNAAAQVRSVYLYHTATLGWSDIGYNFLVDRFGTVYEGRYGSIDRAVQGAHAGGFNTDTMGVSALGNYDTVAAPAAMVDAIGRVAGWKLAQYGADPAGTARLVSAGGGTSRYAAGTQVTVPAIFPHKQVGATACPGRYLDAQLPRVRSVAVATARTASEAVRPATPPPPIGGNGAVPVVGDVDGDGAQDLGWFRDGRWAFRLADGAERRFVYGAAGDRPVVGDWDDDGTDGVGVFRRGDWHLRQAAAAGPAQVSFRFGGSDQDRPVVGAWAGQVQDGIGVFRDGTWYTRRTPSGGAPQHSFLYGTAGDQPLLGEWLGDGAARPGVVRQQTWMLATSIQRPKTVYKFSWSRATDAHLVTDVDGDGVSTATAVRDSSFFLRDTNTPTSTATTKDFAG